MKKTVKIVFTLLMLVMLICIIATCLATTQGEIIKILRITTMIFGMVD